MYQLLDRVTVPELVPSVIDTEIRPYCARHKLNIDTVLLEYIKVSAMFILMWYGRLLPL